MRRIPRSLVIVITLATIVTIAACSRESPQAAIPASPPPSIPRIDSLVVEALQDGKVPGLALTIVRGDSVIHSKGYGFADLAAKRAMTDSTPVVIGSTSKTVTALAIMQLVDEGKVALDSSASRYVKVLQPGGPAPADPRFARITVRHLLTNVGGIPAGFSGDPFDTMDTSVTALEDVVRNDMLPHKLDFTPGEGYKYSNRGFSLASLVVQDASGLSYEDYVNQRIFAPAGMTHSTGRFWEGKGRGMTIGYRETVDGTPAAYPPSLGRAWTGSGMILSTSRDAARMLQAVLNGGTLPGGTSLVSAQGATELLRPQQKAESELGGETMYGLGWEISDMGGTKLAMKGGSVISMGSLFVMLPEQRIGVAMVFNAIDYGKVQLVPNILKALTGAPTTPYKPLPVAPAVPPSAARVPADRLAALVGNYHTRAGIMRLTTRGDTLAARYEGNDVILEPQSESTFVIRSNLRDQEGTPLTFRTCGPTKCIWVRGDSDAVRK